MNWQAIKEFIANWYWLPLALMYLSIILSIIGENRNPGKSLAYILVLVFLPVVGLVIYYFVGRQPVFKKPIFNKKIASDRKQMKAFYEMLTPIMQQRLEVLEDQIGDSASAFRYLFNMRQSLISNGNRVRLLSNGEEFFPALFAAIENAEKHIHIESYILTADDTGNRLIELLVKKNKQGVEVRVIADDVGSNKIKRLPKKMKETGILFLRTLPVTFNSIANSNYRNHRKVAVIDCSLGFIGGINLDNRYWNNGKHKLFWRDTSVAIEGPAVNLLQVQFFLSWLFSGGELQTGQLLDYLVLDNLKKGEATIAIAASGPGSDPPYIMETMLLAIGQARETIRITTPYLFRLTNLPRRFNWR